MNSKLRIPLCWKVAGILSPKTGSQVRLRGEELTQLDPASRARLITYVGAELRAEFPLTAFETVTMDVSAIIRF